MANEINIMVGGEAGQGVQSVGFLLAKALTRWGYHIFADQDYESRVRGGHNFFRVRAGDSPVEAISEAVDILVALNKETIDLHRQEIRDGGVIIYDGEKIKGLEGKNLLNVPADRLAKETAGDNLMSNTVALGAALASSIRKDRRVTVSFFGDGATVHCQRASVVTAYDTAADHIGREK